jgi:DNA-binding Xre family transcriptional regulator
MNPIQKLERAIQERFPGARLMLDPAEKPNGSSFLDVETEGYLLNVEWRPHCGFGVTSNPDSGYGEGADEVYPDLASARERVAALLHSRTRTGPPAAATLESLRRARRVTQSELARHLGKRQASIAKLERRSDIRLSTLQQVVAAMGGRLVVRAQFPDGMDRELQFTDQGPAAD